MKRETSKKVLRNNLVRSSWLILAGLAFVDHCALAQAQFTVTVRKTADQMHLSWPASLTDPSAGVLFPEYGIERSTDLLNWTPIGSKVRALAGRSGQEVILNLNVDNGTTFFRVSADPGALAESQTGQGGAEVFGYNLQLSEELRKIGYLSLDAFLNSTEQPSYLDRISWDPKSATFWTEFNLQTNRWGGTNTLALNADEEASFLANGFVVSERLSPWSFGLCYDDLFYRELPAFVTTDSILHAWHWSYAAMLVELESMQVSTLMESVLTNMYRELPALYQQVGSGPLGNSLADADYFLSVALSLWAGKQVPTALASPEQMNRVSATLADIASLQFKPRVCLFGPDSPRAVDFSQFKVRGHYTRDERLNRYFAAMMWCGRIELRIATFDPDREDDIRQLGTAIVLHQLLKNSGQFENWRCLEHITRAFVGITDSMTFDQLDEVLAAEKLTSLAHVPDLSTLARLQTRLLSGELGAQMYAGDRLNSPMGIAQNKLPRSFTLMGQKFILDGWAHAQVVFDQVLWPTNDPPRVIDNKVTRRKTSALDVAYTVLGNDQVAPILAERINNPAGMPFRDGLPYQHQLKAVRNVVDSQSPALWSDNIYTAWLAALRELSSPTVDPIYPEAMRTRAWAMRTLNSQLGSWTQLRHDTILYAKQPYSDGSGCGYPDGFVEPRPGFWIKMQELAQVAASAIATLNPQGTNALGVDLTEIRKAQLAFLDHFAGCMETLAEIAAKELAQLPLSPSESQFLQNIVVEMSFYGGDPQVPGWYPCLFYRPALEWGRFMYQRWEPLVVDVHTDLPDEVTGDPGGVLHEGVGRVNLLFIAVNNGSDHALYAGPVFGHYEFYEPGVNRLTDEQWSERVSLQQPPSSPEWTQGWQIPRPKSN